MRVYRYLLNLKSCCEFSCPYLLAINKKEALKFCKDFDGLKVIARRKGTQEISYIDTNDKLMNWQKINLRKYLQDKEFEIKHLTKEEYDLLKKNYKILYKN